MVFLPQNGKSSKSFRIQYLPGQGRGLTDLTVFNIVTNVSDSTSNYIENLVSTLSDHPWDGNKECNFWPLSLCFLNQC